MSDEQHIFPLERLCKNIKPFKINFSSIKCYSTGIQHCKLIDLFLHDEIVGLVKVKDTTHCTKHEFFHYLVTFTEEILNGKLHFLCSDVYPISCHWSLYIPHENIRKTLDF